MQAAVQRTQPIPRNTSTGVHSGAQIFVKSKTDAFCFVALTRARDCMLSGINKRNLMSRLIKELKFFSWQGGGSHKTCHDRIRIAGRLGALLLSLN
nr:phage integrase N-terminal domain-containing protein [Xenorhabdus indica]